VSTYTRASSHCPGSTFQRETETESSTSSQLRCSNVCRTEHRNTCRRLLRSGLRRRHSSSQHFTLRQSTSLDCAALPTKHIRSPGLLCWNALPDDLRDPSRSVGDVRRMSKTALFTRFSVSSTIGMLHEVVLIYYWRWQCRQAQKRFVTRRRPCFMLACRPETWQFNCARDVAGFHQSVL